MRFFLACVIFLASACPLALCAPFQNLSFEQVTIAPAPANYTPRDAYLAISAAAALPGWTVMEDSTVCNAIWGDPVSLDETSVAIVSSASSVKNIMMHGAYEVQLTSISLPPGPGDYYSTSSISQTGDIPASAQSVQFLVGVPTQAGTVPATPYVFVNGNPIFLRELWASGGVAQWAGDVSAYAGTTSTLTFASMGWPNDQHWEEDLYNLDGISFSSVAAPEPSAKALWFAITASWLVLGGRRARRGGLFAKMAA